MSTSKSSCEEDSRASGKRQRSRSNDRQRTSHTKIMCKSGVSASGGDLIDVE